MIEISDVLNLLGDELRDNTEVAKRFRAFIENEKWPTGQIRIWLDVCIGASKEVHDPYHEAFKDIVANFGKRLGFEIEYGKPMGENGKRTYDGIWRKQTEGAMVLQTISTAWPIARVDQFGEYIEELAREEGNENLFGLYIVAQGDRQPLIQQILGTRYRSKIRVIHKDDLFKLVQLIEWLAPVIGAERAIEKVQNILPPITSVDIGDMVNLMIEIATTKPMTVEEKAEVEVVTEEEAGAKPWTKHERFEISKTEGKAMSLSECPICHEKSLLYDPGSGMDRCSNDECPSIKVSSPKAIFQPVTTMIKGVSSTVRGWFWDIYFFSRKGRQLKLPTGETSVRKMFLYAASLVCLAVLGYLSYLLAVDRVGTIAGFVTLAIIITLLLWTALMLRRPRVGLASLFFVLIITPLLACIVFAFGGIAPFAESKDWVIWYIDIRFFR